ncbi:hypothetical protein NFI96_026289, partial [Prochilodus magdalenae]
MTDYSGMDQGPSWDNVFRRYVADGMDKGIAKVALASCIDWENRPYTELVAHAQHAERTLQQQKVDHLSVIPAMRLVILQEIVHINPMKNLDQHHSLPVEGSLQQVDDYMINYMSALCKTLQSIRSQVKEALP